MVIASGKTERPHRRGVLAGLAGVASGSMLALACGPFARGSAGPGAGFRGAGATVRVTYLQRPKQPPNQQVLDGLMTQFAAEVPRIQVEIASASDVHVVQKALALHVAGTPAEIVEWARDGSDLRDSIVDLKPLMARDRASASIFVPTAAEIMSRDGKFMGIPFSISADALAYNPSMLREVGVAPPPVNPNDRAWTMEKFQDYALQLTRRPDRFGWGGGFTGGFAWMDAATYFGVGVWEDKAKRLLINTAEFRRGLQYWVDLRLRHRVVPDAEEVRAIPGGFASGRIGMNVQFSLPANLQFTPALATLPYSGLGRNVSARISPGAMFAGQARQLEAAWELLKWLLEPARNAVQAKAAGHVVTGVVKAADIRRKEFQDETRVDPQAWILQAGYSKFASWGLFQYPQVEIVARNEIGPRYERELLAGQLSVNEFCAFAEQQLQQAIAAGR